ncbi:MAG: sugar kinase, partial [Phycisphaerae bacterium]|nr:sugar kinase [Phycisphaerae bacterium]
VDPTGAGDTFAGGMMGWIASTNAPDPASFDTIRRSLAAGTVVASFNIESFSLDRLRTLTRSELDTRIRQYADMVRIP